MEVDGPRFLQSRVACETFQKQIIEEDSEQVSGSNGNVPANDLQPSQNQVAYWRTFRNAKTH